MLVLAMLAADARAQVDPVEWKQFQPVDVPAAALVKLPLPDLTLDLARPDRADLRVLSPDEEEVPYALLDADGAEARIVPAERLRVRQTTRTTEVYLTTGTSEPVDALSLTTREAAPVRPARIERSSDGETWELVVDGVQFLPAGAGQKTTLTLPRVTAQHLRVTLDDERALPVAIIDARLTLAPPPRETAEVATRIVRREEFSQETLLTLDLGARHLPLVELALEVGDPLFSRDVTVAERVLRGGEASERVLGRAAIARSTTARANDRLRLPLSGTTETHELQVRIANGNSRPLDLRAAAVRRAPVWLVFQAPRAGTFRVLTGNRVATARRYDLSRFAADLRGIADTAAMLGAPTPTPGYHQPDALADAAPLGAALDPKPWAYRRRVTPGPAPVQTLELDVRVLARAQPSLADLRLLRDDRQVPFVVERTTLLRPLKLVAAPANDPAQPRISRWKIALPVKGTPLQRLTLESSTTLFSREVRVFERVEDDRGQAWERELAAPSRWQQSPAHPRSPLTITPRERPVSDTILVAVDNGDNAPLRLSEVEGAYATTRLLFRSEETPLFLYYGHSSASAPRYDLELMAEQLASSDQVDAKLAEEEPLQPSSGNPLAGPGGPLLWIALGAVVVVLLVAIARLLPKPSGGAS